MAKPSNKSTGPLSELYALLKSTCKDSIVAAAVFSGISNLLMLVPAFFMLNVYDKAIGSNSLSTLAVLSIITLFMFIGLGAMEALRSRVLVAIGIKLDKSLGSLVYEATFQQALQKGATHATAAPIQDFGTLRQFISGTGAITVFDVPWIPIYILVMFLFHPVLGWMGVASALLLLCVAVANQRATTNGLTIANSLARKAMNETTLHLKKCRGGSVDGDAGNDEATLANSTGQGVDHPGRRQQHRRPL
jgi:ATP-binding cassette subfamily C protein EexD